MDQARAQHNAQKLEKIQRIGYSRLGLTPPDYSPEAFRERDAAATAAVQPGGELETYISESYSRKGIEPAAAQPMLTDLRAAVAQLDRMHQGLPWPERGSPLSHPQHLLILNRQRERLQKLIETGLPEFVGSFTYLEQRVSLDTLATGELNGRALIPPGDDPADPLYWILLDPTFFDFIYLLSNVYASAIDFKALDWTARRHAVGDESVHTTDCIRFGDERPLRDLFDMLQTFVVHGTGPVALKPFDERIFSFAEALRNQATLFVVAHEYGHIVRGDLEAQQEEQAPWEAELGADIVGWRLTNAVLRMEGTSPETRLGGAALFFMGLALIEMARHELETGEPWNLSDLKAAAVSGPKPSDSHPTALVRLAKLSQEFEDHFPPIQARAAQFIVGLFIDLTNQFWIRLGPNFLILHQKGQRPKPVWKGYIGVEQGQNASELPEQANGG